MKKLFILFVLLLFMTFYESFADCGDPAVIRVWPKTSEIRANSILIVEGNLDLIYGLNNKYKIYLKSGTSKVDLQVLQIIKGRYSLTQALLKPNRKLVKGEKYTLVIDSLSLYETEEIQKSNFKWIVNDKLDHEPPIWKTLPHYLDKSKTQFGCGPSAHVSFCVCVQDESPVMVLTKLKEIKTEKINEYFLQIDSSTLHVGYGMCTGEFYFADGQEYEVSFLLIDACGNKSNIFTNPIQFISPKDNEQGNLKLRYCDTHNNSLMDNIKQGIIVTMVLIAIILTWLIIFIKDS